MARGNMIVTLVAQTKKFSDGLRSAGDSVVSFGSFVKTGFGVALGALGLLGGALFSFLPDFIKMGEEARKSELRLSNIAKSMGLFGDNTEKVTGRISKYAEKLSFLTGVDDELTRQNQAVLLTFSNLAKSADKVGGPFDRATVALLDLEAAGKDLKAVALGKALQDPINNMTALKKAGILLTQTQNDQVKAFMAANNVIGAQDVLLSAIEQQVGGTAEATASATEKMQARFEDVMETLSIALLPAVDTLADKFAHWMDSAQGEEFIGNLQTKFEDFATWIASPEGGKKIDELVTSLQAMAETVIAIGEALKFFIDAFNGAKDGMRELFQLVTGISDSRWEDIRTTLHGGTPPTRSNPSAPGGPITVNVNPLIPTPKMGTTILDAIKSAQRLGSR